jgi:hypothetical protein
LVHGCENNGVDLGSLIEPKVLYPGNERSHWYEAKTPAVVIDVITIVSGSIDYVFSGPSSP